MATNQLYSSDEEFDDGYTDYDAHLGKCKKHINNVAVANKVKAPVPVKINQLPKEKKQQVTKPPTNVKPPTKTNENAPLNTNTHFKPINNVEVDDWEDLM